MKPSSISIILMDKYFSEILTHFGTGLFNYCTCGHCGRGIIVCLSVGSYHTYDLISIIFFHIDFHCRFGMLHLGVNHIGMLVGSLSFLFMESIHLCVCICEVLVFWSASMLY